MKKFTRTFAVLASSAALTFSGMGVASAQSSISDLERLSSWIGEPDNNAHAERELRDAAVDWARRTTNNHRDSLNNQARDAHLPRENEWRWSSVDGTQVHNSNWGGVHYRFYKVERNKYRNMVRDFKGSGPLDGFRNGKYGVHARTQGNHVYVTVAFQR
ncbi:hypothetical protein EAH68_00415 [Corynebacterium hylobatis]|uniref:SCP domain-containing protein n=1 Tax=Corynebacterium hylobatis TaxID=1859290 RepID=A0A3R9ZFY2_9CORY|nr:hypothetical protein [Corynebacterium hylobatis]RSZ66057.1 hypothetical protein EAH68_00415 [Corynebacterium hylobatis]